MFTLNRQKSFCLQTPTLELGAGNYDIIEEFESALLLALPSESSWESNLCHHTLLPQTEVSISESTPI